MPLIVALLAEGVDRNWGNIWGWVDGMVALLAEGVDRNAVVRIGPPGPARSPSSRRAWIEIECASYAEFQRHGRPPRGGRG